MPSTEIAFEPAVIVVARPDHHLLVEPGHISTTRGPKENGFRPAVDPLFRTAAETYGDRVIGIILSGALDDGAHGLVLVKRHGGITIVQDPREALTPWMPSNAIRAAEPHHVARVSEIAAILNRLSAEPEPQGVSTMSEDKRKEKDIAERGDRALAEGSLPGPSSAFTCPDCGGALGEFDESEMLRYRCHVGHAFNGKSLVNRSDEVLETALWTALRTLEETAALRRHMAGKASGGRLPGLAARYEKSSEELERRAEVIRNVLVGDGWKSEAPEEAPEEVSEGSQPQKRPRPPARKR